MPEIIHKSRFEMVTLPSAVQTGVRYFMQQNAEIAGALSRGFRVIYGNEIATNSQVNGQNITVINGTDISNMTVTFCDSSGNIICRDLPLYLFVSTLNNGRTVKIGGKVDPYKSWFNVVNTTNMAGKTICFEFQF